MLDPREVRSYEDHETYRVAVPAGLEDAEHWAREVFEQAPRVVRLVLVTGWRRVLRLELRPRGAPDQVLGWRLRRSVIGDRAGTDQVVLTARSASLSASVTFAVRPGELTVTGRRVARTVAARFLWLPILPVHRLVLRRLLRRAVTARCGAA